MGSDFRWLLTSSASGYLAHGIATTALPLLIVTMTTDPFLVALLPVASGLPWIMFSLHVGALVDRVDRRKVLWVADASRAVLAAALLALVVLDLVSIAALLAVAFLDGIATVVFSAASPAVLPTLVEHDQLSRANSRLQTSNVVTGGLLGPVAGGMLYAIAALWPFVMQAITMTVSALCLRRLPPRPADRGEKIRTTLGTDIREGLRTVLADRILRSLVVTTALLAASTGMLEAVLVLHVVRTLDASEGAYGLLFAVFAAGGLLGAHVTPRVQARCGSRACLLIAATLGVASLAIIAIGSSVYLAGVGMAALGIGSMIYNVSAVTARQERTPRDLLGRVSSVSNLAGTGTLPLAALAAGAIASATDTASTLVVAAVLCGGGLLWLVIDMGPIEEARDPAPPRPDH
ncbi:MAG: MFS transporter [Nocardioides sp.]|uniref:MFS transporter n=1 Tax=Nocardioides sp. TaxID=35761 RepID=UPI003D6A408A